MLPDVDEGGSTDRNQRMSSQTTTALPVLALRSNESAEYKCAEEANERIEEIADRNRMKKCHLGLLGNSAMSALLPLSSRQRTHSRYCGRSVPGHHRT